MTETSAQMRSEIERLNEFSKEMVAENQNLRENMHQILKALDSKVDRQDGGKGNK
jgi:hypothetical protein